MISSAMRMNAKAVLEDKIMRAERRVRTMKYLLSVLPWEEMKKEDEDDLWSYLSFRE